MCSNAFVNQILQEQHILLFKNMREVYRTSKEIKKHFRRKLKTSSNTLYTNVKSTCSLWGSIVNGPKAVFHYFKKPTGKTSSQRIYLLSLEII